VAEHKAIPPNFSQSAHRVGNLDLQGLFRVGGSSNGGRVAAPKNEGIGAMTKLDQLYAEQRRTFDQICALLARELSLGEFATASAEDRNRVELEAEQRVKEWEETTEFRTRANIRPLTPLRRLLSQHQLICETILDQQEIEVVVLAYKKRARRPASF
jgi:hypothetical protein